jgi:DNA replication protein DnaC
MPSRKVDYSRIIPCKCTLEGMQRRQTPHPALGTITLTPQTFDTFKVTKANSEAFVAAKSFAEGDSNFIWLLLYGGTGCGKTHLCNAVRSTTSARGIATRLLSAPELFTSMRFAIKDDSADNVLQTLKEVTLLILDDFGMNYGTGWELPRLEELLDYRYVAYLPTMMTTNLTLSDLPQRISSRFSDTERSCCVYNAAPDYRKRKK